MAIYQKAKEAVVKMMVKLFKTKHEHDYEFSRVVGGGLFGEYDVDRCKLCGQERLRGED